MPETTEHAPGAAPLMPSATPATAPAAKPVPAAAPTHDVEAFIKTLPPSKFKGYPRAAEGRPDEIEVSPTAFVARRILETSCALCGENYLRHPTDDCLHYWMEKPEK